MGKEWVEAIDGVHAHTIESAEDGYNAMQGTDEGPRLWL